MDIDYNKLPAIDTADLPQTYESARKALNKCVRVDECKTWSDKAVAVASYARQAKDQTLERLATRIRARAVRRAGELLNEIEMQSKYNAKKQSTGAGTSFSRTNTARQAGLSKRQQVTAMRLAKIPENEFEEQLSADDPPSITQLAEMQKHKVPKGYQEATKVIYGLYHFLEQIVKHDPKLVINGLQKHEVAKATKAVNVGLNYLGELEKHLERRK